VETCQGTDALLVMYTRTNFAVNLPFASATAA